MLWVILAAAGIVVFAAALLIRAIRGAPLRDDLGQLDYQQGLKDGREQHVVYDGAHDMVDWSRNGSGHETKRVA